MVIEADTALDLDDHHLGEKIENAILAVWRREAESDGLNQLTTRAGLSWDDVEVLRALTRYLQAGRHPLFARLPDRRARPPSAMSRRRW